MKKAAININILDNGGKLIIDTSLEGECRLIMQGLTNAIKELELQVSEENRADYRSVVLAMLNDRF